MTTVTIEKLSATVGAMVVGVDRDRLRDDDTLPGLTLEALEANGVLVFRDLHIDDATQVAFSKKLGQVEVLGTGEHPEIFRIVLDPARNPMAAYLRGTFDWHIDGLSEDIPIMATLLSAHAVAPKGGETEFASTYQAYDDLTEEEKERFESLRVVHSVAASLKVANPEATPEEIALWRKRPAKEHPLIWNHRSGRRSLVLGSSASQIVGLDEEASQALLLELLARATSPERVYRHEWQVGDMVIWDNRGVLHRALPYDPTSPRDMHRTTLFGDEPVQ